MATINPEQKMIEIKGEIARLRQEAETVRDGITYAQGQAIVAVYNSVIRALTDLENNIKGMTEHGKPDSILRAGDGVKNSGGWTGTLLYIEGDEGIVQFHDDRQGQTTRYKLSDLARSY